MNTPHSNWAPYTSSSTMPRLRTKWAFIFNSSRITMTHSNYATVRKYLEEKN